MQISREMYALEVSTRVIHVKRHVSEISVIIYTHYDFSANNSPRHSANIHLVKSFAVLVHSWEPKKPMMQMQIRTLEVDTLCVRLLERPRPTPRKALRQKRK